MSVEPGGLAAASPRRLVPDWLHRTLHPAYTSVPWHDVVRSGLAVPVPLGIGIAVHQVPDGLFGTLGALLGVLAERSGTGGQRTARIAATGTAGVVSMTLGRFTGGYGLGPLLLVLVFAMASGLLSSIDPMLSFAGMQLLVQMSIAGGLHVPISFGLLIVSYVGGVLWVLLGVWVQSALERTDRLYRVAVSDVITQLSAEARRGGGYTGDGVATSVAAEAALDSASELVLAASPWAAKRRRELLAVRRILAQLPPLALAVDAFATSDAPEEARSEIATTLDALAAAVVDTGPSMAQAAVLPRAESANGRDQLQQEVVDRMHAASSALDTETPNPPSRIGRSPHVSTRDRLRAVITEATTWEYTARVMVCMGVAEIARQLDPLEHSYWILLTTALVLKPDFLSVFARTLQRAVGTMIGAALAVALLLIPVGYGLLVPIAILASGIPYAVRRNYWMFSILITPIVVLLLDSAGPSSSAVVLQRLTNTAIGCTVVLSAGYLFWPPTWRPAIRRRSQPAWIA